MGGHCKRDDSMGVTFYNSEDDDNCHLYTGYVGFAWIRQTIATHYNKEFGAFYKHLFDKPTFDDGEFINEYNKELNEVWLPKLIKDGTLNEKDTEQFLDFLYMCDCDGNNSPEVCKVVLGVIKDIEDTEDNQYFRGCEDGCGWQEFRDLLTVCIEKNQNLMWC